MNNILTLMAILTLYLSIGATEANAQAEAVTNDPLPFTDSTNYMSIQGYQRYLYYRKTGVWPKSKHYIISYSSGKDVSLFDLATVKGSTVIIDLGDVMPDIQDIMKEKARKLAYEAYPTHATFVIKGTFAIFNSVNHFEETYRRPKPKIVSGRSTAARETSSG